MLRAIVLSVISGVLLTAGFPRMDMPLLSWIALVPLLMAVRGGSGKRALLLGFVCGMAHYVTTVYWVRYAMNYYGGIPLAIAIVLLILLSGYLAIYPMLFAFIANKWERRPRLWVWGLPLVWVALEWVRAHALTGFPWANLGYTQSSFLQLIQVADITGVYGISWLVAFASTIVASYLARRRPHWAAAVWTLCLISALAYGSWRLDRIEAMEKAAPPVTVAVVQGNVEQALKWDPAFQFETLERYRALSIEAAANDPKPDVLVWPETAAPFIYGVDETLTLKLQRIIAEAGVPVLFGSPAVQGSRGVPIFLNVAYLVDGASRFLGRYAKQHLVPFGEYVPLKNILFIFNKLLEAVGEFAPGRDPSPLSLNGQKLGVLICYEDIFPELSRTTVRHGATILANLTNDAWYGESSGPYQHMQMAGWRSIEFRTPLVRAANTGVSVIFGASGRSYGHIPLNEQGHLTRAVYPIRVETFYGRWGDVFAWTCTAAALGLVLGSYPRPGRRRTE